MDAMWSPRPQESASLAASGSAGSAGSDSLRRERGLVRLIGAIGFVSLGFVLGVVSWFLLKAAIDFNAGKVVSLGGAMTRLARADYGEWLLSVTAVGLFAYGLFGLVQARYHRV
jgi:hypothetical protein